MIGKTIAEIIDRSDEYAGVDIVFTDGTALRIDGCGYEDSCVSQTVLSPEDLQAEQAEREARAVRDAEAATRRAELDAEEAEAKSSLSPAEFEAWMNTNRPGWRLRNLMKDEFKGALLDLMKASNRLLFEQIDAKHKYGGYSAVIPVFKGD